MSLHSISTSRTMRYTLLMMYFAFVNVVSVNAEISKMITSYLCPGKGNMAVVVCPGGSYFWHDIDVEGHQVAQWLQKNGISAFVLRYRTAYVPAYLFHYRNIFRGNRYPDPQDDLSAAFEYIRSNSDSLGINPQRVGVMGFSAGGHLAMSSAELFPRSQWPAFIAAIYPVVTMSHPCVHKRSRRGLLGESKKNNIALRDSLSMEKHVPDGCPPVFLVNCLDDPIVDYRNSILLDSALNAKNVPHEYLQYKTGGHGFGASQTKGSEESKKWCNEFLKWVKKYFYE